MFTLKEYQQNALDVLRQYFQTCVQLDDAGRPSAANLAFYQSTLETFGRGIPYQPIPELKSMPYVCLRMPTGAGKTFVACHAVSAAIKDLLQADRNVVLWLVPSNAIRQQTLDALNDRTHFYRRALEDALGSITVLDIPQALSVTRPALDNSTAIIVSTIQAFRVDDTEGRKVYESSGSLMDHFSGYSPEALEGLEKYEDDSSIYSLANVLCLRRPVVIVDEAHNARTELSFTTLARFRPSCIVEFTATPDTEKNPSNVLYSVSAAELKAEDMIKMPILLETRANWRELLADAIARLNDLEGVAEDEQRLTGEYLRPIMLLQAQPRRGENPITVDEVERCLLDDFNIPSDQIARATGTDRGLEGVDILAKDCPSRFVITIQALREGWDCPFAYVLCSVAVVSSGTAVEQILGRVMRLPNVKRKQNDDLNQAYAFAASSNFAITANSLVDGLVQNGFNRIEAGELIASTGQPELDLSDLPMFSGQPVSVPIATTESPHLGQLPPATLSKVRIDQRTGEIAFLGPMGEADRAALLRCFTSEDSRAAVEAAYVESNRTQDIRTPAEQGKEFSVPLLAIQQAELPLMAFDESHYKGMLNLAACDPTLGESEFSTHPPGSQTAKIDISTDRTVRVQPIQNLHRQMRLLASDQGWSDVDLVFWLDQTLPNRYDITQDDSGVFFTGLIQLLLDQRGLSLDQLVHDKYRLRAAIVQKLRKLRMAAHQDAYQPFLDIDTTPLVVLPECCFTYDPLRYPINRRYQGHTSFSKHYYSLIGDMNGEEAQYASFLDRLPQVEYWVRNPERTSQAFSLPTSTDRFYPDFVCKLRDGRYLVVEYKGEDRWSNDDSKEKRNLGELWEKRSEGTCLFVMPKGMDLDATRAKLAT